MLEALSIVELSERLAEAEAVAAAFAPSPQQLREEAAAAEALATTNGTPPKSAKVVATMMRRWTEFLDVHGEAYEYNPEVGPTIELALRFQASGRVKGSASGGPGDAVVASPAHARKCTWAEAHAPRTS